MKKNISFSDEHAVSELVGGLILILIALVTFSAIYMYIFPLPIESATSNVKLMGYVSDEGVAIIEHMGGNALSSYKIDVRYTNGTLINTTTYREVKDPWEIGEKIYPPTDMCLLTEENKVRITVYSIHDDSSEEAIFDGILKGKGGVVPPIPPPEIPMLISSLRTDTIDEDLICFNHTIVPDVDALTYIYKWIVDGDSLAEILMPFDTENSTMTKDYSGNAYNGTVVSAAWTSDGIVGGAYHFGGASDYIELSMPSVFDDFSSNDFTISVWVKSDDITDDHRVVLQGGNDDDFALMFQFGTEIHFGVCEGGVKRALRTENLSSNAWYHIAGVWDASEKLMSLYHNGSICTETGYRTYAQSIKEGFDIGHGTASSRFWLGSIDEFQLYDRALSGNQIYQIYLDTKDGESDNRVVVSEETFLGNIWQCIVTPNDSVQDGTPVESNLLTIVSYSGGE